MFSDHLSLHLIGVDAEMLCQMNTKTQAIEEGAGAQHAIMPRAGAGDIGERVGRIGYNQYNGARRRAPNLRDDVAIDFSVLIQQPQSAFGVTAISGATGFFIYTGGNHHQLGIRQVTVVPIDNSRLGTKRCSVAKVSRDRLRAFTRSVQDHDRPRAPACDSGESTRTPYSSRTDDSDFHDPARIRKKLRMIQLALAKNVGRCVD